MTTEARRSESRSNRPEPVSDTIRVRMQTTAQRNTGPEVALQCALRELGLQFLGDQPPDSASRGRADVVFPVEKVAVFVDGCFWHSCPEHGTWPKRHGDWWRSKLLANRRRDEDANRVLRDRGWRVLRFWEHDEPKEAATIVANAVLNDTAAGGAGTAVERGQECGTV